jgi:hypothetical protein
MTLVHRFISSRVIMAYTCAYQPLYVSCLSGSIYWIYDQNFFARYTDNQIVLFTELFEWAAELCTRDTETSGYQLPCVGAIFYIILPRLWSTCDASPSNMWHSFLYKNTKGHPFWCTGVAQGNCSPCFCIFLAYIVHSTISVGSLQLWS